MNAEKPVWVVGLMSGTSLDGIDAALLRTDGNSVSEFGKWLTLPYTEAEKAELREAVHGRGDMLALEHWLTQKHAEAVQMLFIKAGISARDVALIGFHGQTVAHRPQEGITWQIGNGALLAELTGVDVVCDFRRRDVAAGGQGAPLVPLFHAALAHAQEKPVAVLNIGGVANVTWIGRGTNEMLAFDTGPGNALINDWALKHTGKDYDRDGALAASGNCNEAVLKELLADGFFSQTPPKSLDRNHFADLFAPHASSLSPADGAATLTEFTAAAVERATAHFAEAPKQWLVCGGGRHNPVLMASLACRLGNVISADTLGWIGDAMEAQAFAFLAVRSVQGLPLSLPGTTGVSAPITGGALHRAGN